MKIEKTISKSYEVKVILSKEEIIDAICNQFGLEENSECKEWSDWDLYINSSGDEFTFIYHCEEYKEVEE